MVSLDQLNGPGHRHETLDTYMFVGFLILGIPDYGNLAPRQRKNPNPDTGRKALVLVGWF